MRSSVEEHVTTRVGTNNSAQFNSGFVVRTHALNVDVIKSYSVSHTHFLSRASCCTFRSTALRRIAVTPASCCLIVSCCLSSCCLFLTSLPGLYLPLSWSTLCSRRRPTSSSRLVGLSSRRRPTSSSRLVGLSSRRRPTSSSRLVGLSSRRRPTSSSRLIGLSSRRRPTSSSRLIGLYSRRPTIEQSSVWTIIIIRTTTTLLLPRHLFLAKHAHNVTCLLQAGILLRHVIRHVLQQGLTIIRSAHDPRPGVQQHVISSMLISDTCI